MLGYDNETHQAYLDGREPTLFLNAPDTYDYVGTWAPDGYRFFFVGAGDSDEGMYVYDETSGKTTLVSDSVGVPCFSHDGRTMAWCKIRDTDTQVWIMEDFLPESTAGK
jgi:hypothetical protein